MGKVLQFITRQRPGSCSWQTPPARPAEVVPFRLTEGILKVELDRLTDQFLDGRIDLVEFGLGIDRLKKRQGVKK